MKSIPIKNSIFLNRLVKPILAALLVFGCKEDSISSSLLISRGPKCYDDTPISANGKVLVSKKVQQLSETGNKNTDPAKVFGNLMSEALVLLDQECQDNEIGVVTPMTPCAHLPQFAKQTVSKVLA